MLPALPLSRAFLHSWRCRPNITLSMTTLGLDESVDGEDEIDASDFNIKADQVLKSHSGVGLRTLSIKACAYNADTCSYLNKWLEAAVTPGLEELTLNLPLETARYTFPCSLLSNGSGHTIRLLGLSRCAFHTTAGLDCLKNVTTLCLREMRITEDELGCLFSGSIALERLELTYCNKIICLKIPCHMQRLSYLCVGSCERLKAIESNAPNLSSLYVSGNDLQLSLGKSVQMKELVLCRDGGISFACAKLPSLVPNLEILQVISFYEVVRRPIVPRTFLHLKYLTVNLHRNAVNTSYDRLPLVSLLDTAPSLETFVLNVISYVRMQHNLITGEPSPPRQIAERHYNNLRSVKITGFCSERGLVELTWHILENATSLDCLTLETTLGYVPRCFDNKHGKCIRLTDDMLRASKEGLSAIQSYIEGKVPPKVKLNVLIHCILCHGVEL
ncbi:hypothetical protein ACP4OV_014080 [Aristida adscensionis]